MFVELELDGDTHTIDVAVTPTTVIASVALLPHKTAGNVMVVVFIVGTALSTYCLFATYIFEVGAAAIVTELQVTSPLVPIDATLSQAEEPLPL